MKLPDADVLIAWEPHELGLRLLPTLAAWPRGHAFQPRRSCLLRVARRSAYGLSFGELSRASASRD